jgi:hypothetical protein
MANLQGWMGLHTRQGGTILRLSLRLIATVCYVHLDLDIN